MSFKQGGRFERSAGIHWLAHRLPMLCGVLAALAAAAPASAQPELSFFTVQPCRLLDTRDAAGPYGGPGLPTGGIRSFTVGSRCGVPTTARAAALNVTVVAPAERGHLLLYPTGIAQPAASTINYPAGRVRANNTVVGLGVSGAVTVFAGGTPGGEVQTIIDVTGYFEEPSAAAGVAPPVFVPPPGSYTELQAVAMVSSTPGANIRYTTDGSTPTALTGIPYASTLALSSQTTLRAIAHLGGESSAVTTGNYDFSGSGTLYLATLQPEGAAVSTASGHSTLLLSLDETSARVRYDFSNLSSPKTGGHLHGPADPGQSGAILFDLDTTPMESDGTQIWNFAQVGTTTVADIVAAIKGGRIYINLHTSNYPAGEIRGHYNRANGSTTFIPPPPPPPLPPGPPTLDDAARFLHQATWGPKMSEIQALPAQGFESWLQTQFSRPLVSHLAYLDAADARDEEVSDHHASEAIWTQAIAGNDQLRSRVAVALSELLVVSAEDGDLESNPESLAVYMDALNRNAFGNFRQLLEDVTLTAGMGMYLDMLGNDKPDPQTGQNPNENFAREILQLFSIGLYQLHPDGTLKLDARGLPIATYDQDEVIGFAHVFTGWSLGGNDTTNFWEFYWPDNKNFRVPMAAWPSHHSLYPKRLLDGGLLPGSGSTYPGLAELELDLALDNIFRHPNVGPFIARQLIQRLVTSNPSPGYVYRVATAFNNNGAGVRGDMRAVVRAILLDYEARSTTVIGYQGYGKLREPVLRFGGLLRAFNATAPSGFYRIWHIESPEWALGQNVLRSPTVFNFFEPTYSLPGAVATAGLDSPEFQILNETSAIGGANFLRGTIYHGFQNDEDELTLNLSSLTALAGNPAALVDHLDLLLLSGQLSAESRTIMINAISALSASNPTNRARAALRLMIFSPEYLVQK